MSVTQAKLEAFIAIYERLYGVRLSVEEARPIALRVIMLYRVIMRPLPRPSEDSPQQDFESGG